MKTRRSNGRTILGLMLLAWCLQTWAGWTAPAYGLEKYGRPLPSMDEPEHETREEEETL